MPYKPVERVVVLQTQRRFRATKKTAAQHTRFCDALTRRGTSFDPEAQIEKGHVRVFVVSAELLSVRHSGPRTACSVKSESSNSGVPAIMHKHHTIARPIPAQHGVN